MRVTDHTIGSYRAHRRAMESRLARYLTGKLIDGHTICETWGSDGERSFIEMSPVDGRCATSNVWGLLATFPDAYDAGRHYANRRMQGWTRLSIPTMTPSEAR